MHTENNFFFFPFLFFLKFVLFFIVLSLFTLIFSRFPIARGIEQHRTRPKIVIYFGAIHNRSFVLSSVCISLVLTVQTSKLKIYIQKFHCVFPHLFTQKIRSSNLRKIKISSLSILTIKKKSISRISHFPSF